MLQHLTKIYKLGIKDDLQPEDERRAILINQILFFSTLLVFTLVPIVYLFAEMFNVVITFCCGLIVMSPLFFSYKGKHDFAVLFFVISSSMMVAAASILIQNTHSDLFLILLVVIPFLTLRSERKKWIILIFIVLLFIGLNIAYKYIEPVAEYNESQKFFAYLSNIIAITLVITIFLIKLKQQNQHYEDEMIEQKHITDGIYKEILDSIIYAKRIQSAILPSSA